MSRGHPSYNATISEVKSCKITSTIPHTKGHPSNKGRFSIPQWVPYKTGTTVKDTPTPQPVQVYGRSHLILVEFKGDLGAGGGGNTSGGGGQSQTIRGHQRTQCLHRRHPLVYRLPRPALVSRRLTVPGGKGLALRNVEKAYFSFV